MLDKKQTKFRNTLLIISLVAVLITLVYILFNLDINKLGGSQKLSEIKEVSLISPDGKKISVKAEIARTGSEQEKGLMNRTKMSDTEGMLFIFPVSSPQSFWMKNTYIPLDMIYFDEYGKFVNVSQNAQPCIDKGDSCPLYNSEGNAKYVLEVNGGWLNKNFDYDTPKLDMESINNLLQK